MYLFYNSDLILKVIALCHPMKVAKDHQKATNQKILKYIKITI